MKLIKKLGIIILLIIIVLLIIIFYTLKKDNKSIIEENNSYDNFADQIIIDKNLKEVSDPTFYYTVSDCVNNYIKAITTDIESSDSYDNYIPGTELNFYLSKGIVKQEEKNQYIFSLLDKKYVDENSITYNNVNKYTNIDDFKNNYTIENIYEMLNQRICEYVVYLENDNNNKLCFLVILDNENDTYMIRPIDYIESSNLKIELIYEEIDEIEKNGNNSFYYNRMTNDKMAKKYFNMLKYDLINNPEKVYDKLNSEYKEKRFGNSSNYMNYIETNKEYFENIRVEKYLVNVYDSYKEYVCKDQYENIYIFNVYAVMNYDIKLDTYTLENEKFIEEYNKSNDEKKGQMNIDKFFQMINRHDYTSSYKYISNNFKNNYFQDQEEFEKYIKNNFYDYNKFEFKKCESVSNNIYLYTIEIENMNTEDFGSKEIKIIIKLNENMDYEISFGME